MQDLEKEINSAISKLEAQAEAAKKYNLFKEQLKQLEAQLAYLKKETAAKTWKESQEKLKQTEVKLEQKKTELTKAELAVENSREDLKSENEALNPIQANFYEISSKVSSVESKIESNRNEEKRAKAQVEQSNNRIKEITEELARLNNLSDQLKIDLTEHEKLISEYQNTYKEKEDYYKKTESEFSEINNEFKSVEENLQESKEQLRLDQNTISFMDGKIQDFEKRFDQLQTELKNQENLLNEANSSGDENIAELSSVIEGLNEEINSKKDSMDDHSEVLDALYDERQDIQTELSQVEAEIKSLNSLIDSQVNQEQIDRWLEVNHINSDNSLLNKVKIDEKFAKALDSVMGVKSNAYFSSKFNTHESSFGVTVMTSSSESIHNSNFEDLKPLNQLIEIEPEYKPVIMELTQNIFIIEDLSACSCFGTTLRCSA